MKWHVMAMENMKSLSRCHVEPNSDNVSADPFRWSVDRQCSTSPPVGFGPFI